MKINLFKRLCNVFLLQEVAVREYEMLCLKPICDMCQIARLLDYCQHKITNQCHELLETQLNNFSESVLLSSLFFASWKHEDKQGGKRDSSELSKGRLYFSKLLFERFSLVKYMQAKIFISLLFCVFLNFVLLSESEIFATFVCIKPLSILTVQYAIFTQSRNWQKRPCIKFQHMYRASQKKLSFIIFRLRNVLLVKFNITRCVLETKYHA